MRTYSIYIIKNTINDKVYIGQTSQSVEERFRQHKRPSTMKQRGSYKIYNAMKKYGKENFYVEKLESGIPESEIDKKEMDYIQKYNSYENGYNSTLGGDGKTISKIEDIKKFTELYKRGMKQKNIASIFNVSEITVQRTANSLGLNSRVGRVTKEYLLKNLNHTNEEMARELGVNTYTITRGFRKYGIKRGKGFNNANNAQNKPKIQESRKDEFCKMWFDRSISLQTMAEYFEVNKRQLFRYSKNFGLPERRTIKRSDKLLIGSTNTEI